MPHNTKLLSDSPYIQTSKRNFIFIDKKDRLYTLVKYSGTHTPCCIAMEIYVFVWDKKKLIKTVSKYEYGRVE